MPCPPSVPISIIPPVAQGVGPLVWANGSQVARLTVPLNPSFLVYDGSKTTWGDGSVTSPVLLPNLQQVAGSSINYYVGLQSNGQLAAFANTTINPNDALVTATGSTTPRTLANRFADVVNVKDFGAKGDGVTDDTTAIQLALNSAAGRTCYIPSGNYNVSSPLVFKISGNGLLNSQSAILADASAKITATTAIEAIVLTNDADEHIGSAITGGMWDCNGLANSAFWVKYGRVLDISNLEIWNNLGAAIRLGSQSAGGYSYDVMLSDFYIRRTNVTAPTNSSGVYFDKCADSQVLNGVIIGQNTGIKGNASFGTYNIIVNIVHIWNTQQHGLLNSAVYVTGSNWRLSNLYLGCGVQASIFITNSANPCNVNNSLFLADSFFATGTFGSGIFVDTSCSVTVIGCSFAGVSGSEFPYDISGSGIYETYGNNSSYCQTINAQMTSIPQKGTVTYFTPSTYPFAIFSAKTNVLSMGYDGTDSIIQSFSSKKLVLNKAGNDIKLGGNSYPTYDNSYTLGANGARWSVIWAATSTISTSDERSKTDVQDSSLGLNFINSLRPVSYRFKVGSNVVKPIDESNPSELVSEPVAGERVHYGLLAQEVKEALPDGIDFGGWVLTDKNNSDSEQGLRYEEFIAPLVKAIQEQQAQIMALQAQVSDLSHS